MKSGEVVLTLGILLFCAGLFVNSTFNISSEILSSYVWLLIWFGACLWIAGIAILLFRKEEPKKVIAYQSVQVKERNFRLISFITNFVIALVVGFIVLWLTNFIWGTEDPRFYQLVIPGYLSGAVILALMSSLERQ